MTPAARIAAAIDLLAAIEAARATPSRRSRQRLFPRPPLHRRQVTGAPCRTASGSAARPPPPGWWLADGAQSPRAAGRRLAAAGGLDALAGVAQAFPAAVSPRRRWIAAELAALRRLEGHTLDHPEMPDAVRLEVPDWLLPASAGPLRRSLGSRTGALLEPAPLDLRVNLLKATRDAGAGGSGRRGPGRRTRQTLALGPADRRPPPGHRRPRLPVRTGRDPGRGQPARRRPGGAAPGHARRATFAPAPAARRWRWPMTMDNRGQHLAVRHLCRAAGGCRAPPAPRRRLQRRAPLVAARRQMGQAPCGEIRSRAGGCALHWHWHLAPQSRRAAASDQRRSRRADRPPGRHTRRRRAAGSQTRTYGLRYLRHALERRTRHR